MSARKRLSHVLGHDLRLEILGILNQRAASPAELHRELGEDLSEISYHVNVLLQAECVELVGARTVGGSVERFYRATERAQLSAEQMEEIPMRRRRQLTRSWVSAAFDAVAKAEEAGTLDARSERHLSLTPVQLDERGWGELTEATAGYLDSVLEIEERSSRRLGDRGGGGVPAMVTIMTFEMPPGYRKLGPRRRAETPLP